jgi:nitrous oxide reductase accessory protein NosL
MKLFITLLTSLVITTLLFGLGMQMKMFQSVPPKEATLLQKGKEKKFCPVCGMNLSMFYKTNHAAHVHGKEKQYCSLHCLVEDKELNHADLKDIQVIDVTSKKFINAKDAYYVVGSHKKGTMSMVSKYAFKNLTDAATFAQKNGGVVMDFNGAYAEAKKDFKNDARMITKKQAMMAKKGAMIYNKMCQKTEKKFESIAQAKAFVVDSKLCKNLDAKKLQAVGLYLYKR